MAINKNFVVKNGLEVNTDQIFADSATNKVGIGSTLPTVALDVQGGIAATDVVSSLLRITGFATLPFTQINNNLNISGFSTAQRQVNVLGMSSISNLRVVGVTTFENNVNLAGNVNVTGFSTFVGLTSVVGNLKVSGFSTFSNLADFTNNVKIAGVTTVSTLGSPSEVIVVGTGKSLASLSNVIASPSGLNVTGYVTATNFSGSFSGTGIAIGIQSEGTTVSTATSTINFVPVNASVTVNQSDGGAGITTVTFQSSGISIGLAIALGG
jgi:hypothetical protein